MAEAKAYAVIKSGGQQFRVSPGSRISIQKFEGEPGSEIVFSEVMMHSAGGEQAPKIGTPLLSGVKVTGKVVAQEKGPKVLIYKKTRRTGYTKKQGHRQNLTRVLIESISA
ncbi:MAG: 50S ribosomal protein L21 [Deltaproteobacteria bacterium]|nr:50S ribosomal protein L21 [Deltaproteobacteria bacterium]